jgi:5-methylcytosine-specific restriction endonuclease McrA
MSPATKCCAICHLPKPLDDFPLNRKVGPGRARRCKACRLALTPEQRAQRSVRRKAHYQANKARTNAQNAAYYLAHKDALRPVRQAWEARHREKRSGRFLVANLANPEALRARRRLYYANNRAKMLAKNRRYYRNHPEKEAAKDAKRRARKAAAPINDFTATQWLEIQAVHDHRCAYCGKRAKGHLTQDHITPLSKGGSNTASNIIPACKSCNSRKNDRAVLIPVQPLLLTVAPSKPMQRRKRDTHARLL